MHIMPNEQLAAYVEAEVTKGVGRNEIAKALIAAGWPQEEVTSTMIALSVPVAGVSVEPVVSSFAPVPPSSPVVPPFPPLNKPLSAPIPAMPAPLVPVRNESSDSSGSSSDANSEKLPGVFALIQTAIDLYRARFSTILKIVCVEALVGMVGMAVLGFSVAVGVVSGAVLFAGTAKTALYAFMGIGTLVAIAFGILLIWLSTWIMLALYHAIRGAAESIEFKEAFRRARPQIWALVWIGVLSGLTVLGALMLFAALPAAFVYFGATLFLGTSTPIPVIIAGIVGGCAALAVVAIFGTWFFFTTWILVDTDTRGIPAILASRRLAYERFGAVFGRWLALAVLTGLATIPISIVSSIISHVFPEGARHYFTGFVNQVAMFVILYPVLFAAMFSLYEAVKMRTSTVDAMTGRGKIIVLAGFGVLGALLLPFVAAVLLTSLHTALGNSFDKVRTADIGMVQNQLEIYQSTHGEYPPALSVLATPGAGPFVIPSSLLQDPLTHVPFTYQVAADGGSYTVCATMSTLKLSCVHGSSVSTTTSSFVETSSITWKFDAAGVDAQAVPLTNVTLIVGDKTYPVGKYQRTCKVISDLSSPWFGTSVIEGETGTEVSGVRCYYGGGGDEIGVFKEGTALVVKRGEISEPQGPGSGGAFRGNFETLFTL